MEQQTISERFWLKYPIKSVLNPLIVGYIIGVILTGIWDVYFTQNSSTEPRPNRRVWMLMVLLVLTLLILSYSRSVRCTITLALPILCQNVTKGRSLIIALVIVLVATGPIWNMLRNVNVLITSLTCGQKQLKRMQVDMWGLLQQPLVIFKYIIGDAAVRQMQEPVVVLVSCIKNAYDWFGNIVVCNKDHETPLERCIKVANDTMHNCREKMGPLKVLCHATHLFTMLCYSSKIVDALCWIIIFLNDFVLQPIVSSNRSTDVQETFHHDLFFKIFASKDLSEFGAEIIPFFGYFDIVTIVLCCAIILKAIYFRMRYIRSPDYNNKYITSDFLEIDAARQLNNQELVLPLTIAECKKYIQMTPFHVTKQEVLNIISSLWLLTILYLQLFCICFADYGFYWLLKMIGYYYFGYENDPEIPPYISEDSGFSLNLIQNVINGFKRLTLSPEIDTSACLLVPSPPNLRRYYEISCLCLLEWLVTICQPYGLRYRQAIMQFYYPQVARERALWLYNEILLERKDFFKFRCHLARAGSMYNAGVDNFPSLGWIWAQTNKFWIFRWLYDHFSDEICIICREPLGDERLVCATINCSGVFCGDCYQHSNNICGVCHWPVDQGDWSDISEEEM